MRGDFTVGFFPWTPLQECRLDFYQPDLIANVWKALQQLNCNPRLESDLHAKRQDVVVENIRRCLPGHSGLFCASSRILDYATATPDRPRPIIGRRGGAGKVAGGFLSAGYPAHRLSP